MIARYGVLWLDYYVNGSGRGDFVFRAKHPRRIMWEPPFESPHDPQCGWLIEERWMTLRDIRSRKKWKHAEDVIPDDGVSRTARSGAEEGWGDRRTGPDAGRRRCDDPVLLVSQPPGVRDEGEARQRPRDGAGRPLPVVRGLRPAVATAARPGDARQRAPLRRPRGRNGRVAGDGSEGLPTARATWTGWKPSGTRKRRWRIRAATGS